MRLWFQDGWPLFQLAHTLLPLLTFGPLLALWTSHEHHSLFFLISLLTFYTGIGVFWLYMFYSRVSWVVDLLAHLLHYFFVVPTSFFIILHCLYLLFHLYFFHHIFLCLEWWFFIFQCMKDGHILFHSYLMDVGLEILSWEGYLGRESLYTSVFGSVSILLWILNRVRLLIFKVCAGKKKKRKEKKKKIYIKK